MIFFLLILMFFVGVVQVCWTPIHMIITKKPEIRRHFAYYSLGVVVYFLLLWALGGFADVFDSATPLVMIHFFGGAALLCGYHCWIVSKSMEKDLPIDPLPFEA